ncbi:hypothetical protein K402DRAFT_393236 [Aulographum hederae CBS 113979]|uniref:Uncharacterized protein n=1 Tax=Aulographum hederae CBS 113979 TaxID=1176131 RepID=A0A6G1H1H3_9PEZI|nr:hypothetical protein K402DRAFT_393236 [Aulographum hederae CBS 113979]
MLAAVLKISCFSPVSSPLFCSCYPRFLSRRAPLANVETGELWRQGSGALGWGGLRSDSAQDDKEKGHETNVRRTRDIRLWT